MADPREGPGGPDPTLLELDLISGRGCVELGTNSNKIQLVVKVGLEQATMPPKM